MTGSATTSWMDPCEICAARFGGHITRGVLNHKFVLSFFSRMMTAAENGTSQFGKTPLTCGLWIPSYDSAPQAPVAMNYAATGYHQTPAPCQSTRAVPWVRTIAARTAVALSLELRQIGGSLSLRVIPFCQKMRVGSKLVSEQLQSFRGTAAWSKATMKVRTILSGNRETNGLVSS